MTSTVSSRRRIGKGTFVSEQLAESVRNERVPADSAALSFDLMSQLTYMLAISSAGATRDQLFQSTIRQGFRTAIPFRRVYQMAKRLGMEYSRAFQFVARQTKAETLQSLLLRFSGAIATGESEREFLASEAKLESERYIGRYERGVESLKKWTDGYAALLVSLILIIVVAMISTMITTMGNVFVLVIGVAMVGVTGVGSYVIYKAAPVEVKTYTPKSGKPVLRRRSILLARVLIPLGLGLGIFAGYQHGVGVGLIIFGLLLLPAGFFAWRDDRLVGRVDGDLPAVIRSLGSVTASLGSTVTIALRKLDRRSLGSLEPFVNRLNLRLSQQISPDVCWNRFVGETGSELARRTTRSFTDGVSQGGDPQQIGEICSDYALTVSLLRAKRGLVSSTFTFLTFPLHIAMTGLLVFIFEVVESFNTKLAAATSSLDGQTAGGVGLPKLPFFESHDLTIIALLTVGTVLALTFANSLVPRFAGGGHPLRVALYGGFMCVFSGINLVMVPTLAQKVFSI